jgi:polysaccharide export outer membrane protein
MGNPLITPNTICTLASQNASKICVLVKRWKALSAFGLLLSGVSCTHDVSRGSAGIAATLPAPRIAPTAGGYRIQAGDLIDVFVLEDSTFNGTFTIRPSGDIIMPKVGRIGVQGLTLTEAEARIKRELQANQLRLATVIVDPGTRGEATDAGGLTLRMSGEIAQTGRVTVRPLGHTPVSAYQAIVEAGGFKPFANKRKAYILRHGPMGVMRIEVNFEAVETGEANDPTVFEGDCIVVPKKLFGL